MRVSASSMCVFAVAVLVWVWGVPSEGQAVNAASPPATTSNTPPLKRITPPLHANPAPVCNFVSSARPSALWPVATVGLILVVAAGFGFHAAANTEASPRSAIYIAKGAHATLVSGLTVLIIYAVAVAAVVFFR